MIDKVSLRDFMQFKKLNISLGGMTTLVGESRTGKTTVLLAIQWVMTNQPVGDWMIRHGAKVAKVRLVVDGHEVIRRKGARVNEYVLDGRVMKAFGPGQVPEEVAKLLNVSPLSFQNQADSQFWMTDSPGEVGRQLNRLAGLELMDKAVATANSSHRAAVAALERSETRSNVKYGNLKALEWVPDMMRAYVVLYQAVGEEAKLRTQLEALCSLIRTVEGAEVDVTRFAGVGGAYREMERLLAEAEDTRRFLKLVNELRGVITEASIHADAGKLLTDDARRLDEMAVAAESEAESLAEVEAMVAAVREAEGELRCAREEERSSTAAAARARPKGACPMCGSRVP